MYPRVKTSAETHWIKSWLTVLEPTEERTPLPVTSVPLMELLARMELLYVVFHLPCLASAKREDDAALPRPGEVSAGFPSPRRFCACWDGSGAKIRKWGG